MNLSDLEFDYTVYTKIIERMLEDGVIVEKAHRVPQDTASYLFERYFAACLKPKKVKDTHNCYHCRNYEASH